MNRSEEIKRENKSIMLSIVVVVVIIVALSIAGLLLIKPQDETVQGQIEGTSVRVSGKLPGRLVELYVEQGAMVKQGDTLAHVHSSLVEAKMLQAQSMEAAASAQSAKAEAGTRTELVTAA